MGRFPHLTPRPTVSYLHYWMQTDEVQSTLLTHNFYSILAGGPGPCEVRARFFISTGRLVDEWRGNILARGQLALVPPMAGEGSVQVEMPVPRWFPDAPGRAAARFYMLYRSPAGMCSMVHAIEEAPSWRQWRSRWPHRHAPWQSTRTIDGQGVTRIRVIGINHAPWRAHQHWIVRGVRSGYYEQVQGMVPSRGLLTLDFEPPAGLADDWIVKSGCLSTKNGKPYVWVGRQGAPPAAHHG